MITQKELKELLHYCPDTGVFTWLVKPSKNISIGSTAGTVHHGKTTSYIRVQINSKRYFAHRLAWIYMNGEPPICQIDHIDGNGNNNKIENLRCVDNAENSRNQRLSKRSNTGVCGVTDHFGRFRAIITVDYKSKHLGIFSNMFDAICARKSAENKHGFHVNHGRLI